VNRRFLGLDPKGSDGFDSFERAGASTGITGVDGSVAADTATARLAALHPRSICQCFVSNKFCQYVFKA
jgi:hypothetical protein